MSYITGTLLISNVDYGTSVSAIDVGVNGSQFAVAYLDDSGNLKTAITSPTTVAGINTAMSGCNIVI